MSKKHKKKKRQEILQREVFYLPKKNKKKDNYKNRIKEVSDLEQEFMNDVADTLEEYIDIADRRLIIEDVSYQEKDDAIKDLAKAIKKLRKGNPTALWGSAERYNEEFQSWKDSHNKRERYGYY